MTSIFKKSLACCLAVALCLTCMLGALTVSAEVKTGTFTVDDATVTPGTATADVKVTIDAEAANVIIMQVETEAGEVTAVRPADAAMQAILDAKSKNIYVSNGDGNIAPFDSVVIFVTVALADAETETEYDVTAKLNKAGASTNNEEEIEIADGKGKIIVKAEAPSHVHTPAEAVVENEVAATCTTDGSYDLVVYCSDEACKAEISRETKTVAAKGHVEGEFVDAKQATETAEGTITFACATCGQNFDKSLAYNKYNTIISTGAEAKSEIIMNLSGLTSVIKSDDMTTTFIVVDSTRHSSATDFTTERAIYTYDDAIIDGNYIIWNVGIASNYMTEELIIDVYSCQNGQWYSGLQAVRSFAEFALTKVQGSATDAIKTILVDAVNYGAAAQVITNHYTSNLANAKFADYQYNGSTPYGSDTTVIPEAVDNYAASNTGSVWFVGVGLEGNSKIVLRPQILPHPAQFKGDVNDIVVVASFTDSTGAARSVAYVNDEAAVANLPVEVDKVEELKPASSGYYVPMAEIASNEMDVTVTFQVYVDGVADSSAVSSVEDAVARMAGSATQAQKDVFYSLLRYGASAKAGFPN